MTKGNVFIVGARKNPDIKEPEISTEELQKIRTRLLPKRDCPENWEYKAPKVWRGSFDLPDYKMSPERAEEILKNCGILGENGEIVEAFKDILVKRKP